MAGRPGAGLGGGAPAGPRSCYHGSPEEAGLEVFLQRLLADPAVELPRAAVVDVGPIEGRGWAVIEQNAAWGAGIYECDPFAVLEVLRQANRGA